MTYFEVDDLIYFAVQFISFFIISFIGAILKEIYDTNSSPNHEFSPFMVFAGTTLATISSVIFQDNYLDGSGWKLMIGISFAFGLIGSEVFTRISNIKGIKTIISIIVGRKPPEELLDDLEDDEKKNEETNKHHKDNESKVDENIKISPKVHIHLYKDEENKK